MYNNITIKTLAKELNVSIATVSKALKDRHDIGVATKQRVVELAHKLNYIPNPYAGGLRKRKSKTIALVLPEVADSFFSLAINGIEATAQEKEYHVLIYLTHESFTKEQAILKDFQSGRVDGVLMSITSETSTHNHIQELYDSGMPIVFFDRVCESIDTAKITTDDFEGGYKATQHLIDCGCKKIALLSISTSLSISNKRMEGYKKALDDNHIKFSPSDIVQCSNDAEKSYNSIKKLLSHRSRPDGIIATVEKFTTNTYLACKELGLFIPGDVKVISFSNLPTAPILNPSLTTITQPAFEMGKAASTVLFKALNKSSFNLKQESIVIPSVLTVRGSTATQTK
ncbi:MAG: LacI family DNA-binding transcriptional regulator [Rhizobacter sp.]|nr:LacI family DNA-binding transcriptional regulator [Ferruginibacter sp.]